MQLPWRETKGNRNSRNDERRLRLDCKCNDEQGNDIDYTHATMFPITRNVVRIKQILTITIIIMLLLTMVKQLTN